MRIAAACLALAALLSLNGSPRAQANETIADATGGTELRLELEAGLKARQPAEFQFIAQVVQLVDAGTLPVDLVKSTFQWARGKKPHFPFPYFERGLRLRAAELGISFDG